MPAQLITVPSAAGPGREPALAQGPVWGLRIEGQRVSLVLQGAELPAGAALGELAIHLPHVGLPFDFRDGIARFRHHRGEAETLEIAIEARVLLDHLHEASGGLLTGRAVDDALVLSGYSDEGARFTVRARLMPDPEGPREGEDEPALVLSLYQMRVYGRTDEPWPLLARRVLDQLPESLVVERTLTTARLRFVRRALAWTLSGLGWKLPDLSSLAAQGVALVDGRLIMRFAAPEIGPDGMLTLDAVPEGRTRGAFERFVEDLELKRHHGQIDRLLADDRVREALAEVYRALDGPPQPGFLAERLIGICASRAILYDEGEKVCRELLAIAPGYPPALCGLASIAMGRGHLEEAAVHFERLSAVLTASSEREDATACDMTLAESLRAIDPDEARAALERVLARSPDHEEALEALIRLAEDAGDTPAALPLYKRLLFAARSTDRTRYAGLRLARQALERRQPEEARVFLRVVLEAAPHDLEALVALADVERAEGRLDEAVKVLSSALRYVAPTEGERLVRVVERLAQLSLGPLGEPARARRVLWRAVDAVELGERAGIRLARLAVEAGAPELVDRFTEGVTRASDAWSEAATLRAQAWLQRGETARAMEGLLEVVERGGAPEEALTLLERCARDMDSRERLLHPLRKASERARSAPERARVSRALAELYEALELDWDAIAPYEQVLSDGPPLGESQEARGVAERLLDLYARFGMWPQHQTLCRELLETAGSDPEARVPLLVRLGRASLQELGDAEGARAPLVEAVHLAPRRVEALALLRDTLDALGDGEALIPVLRRLESVHADERVRVASRIRLAELQLDALGAPGQARATLERLPRSVASEPRVLELKRRLGLETPDVSPVARPEPVAPIARPEPFEPPQRAAGGGYERALQAADRGDAAGALAELEALLAGDPLNVPALELARIVALTAGRLDEAVAYTDVLVELTVDRAARIGLLEEIVTAAPERAARQRALLERLRGADEPKAAAPPPGPAPTAPRPRRVPPTPDPTRAPTEAAAPAPARVAPQRTQLPEAARERVAEGDRLEALLATAAEAMLAEDGAAAGEALDEALAIDADYVPALELKAELLEGEEAWEELVWVLAHLADLAFDARQTLAYTVQRGHVLADRLGDMEAAAEAWAQVADWQPLDDAVFQRLAAFYRERERHGELADLWARRAEVAAETAAGAADPRPFERARATARLEEAKLRLSALDDPEGAVDAVAPVLEDRPEDPELLECYVRALAAANRREECRAALDRLLPMLLPGPLRDEMLLLRGG